jgi:predicted ATPase
MKIDRMKIENFKSFDSVNLDFGDLNILIGANSSGKSNFVHLFEFIRDIATCGLEDAIALQGGPTYIMNTNLKSNRKTKIELSLSSGESLTNFFASLGNVEGTKEIKIKNLTYRFSIFFNKRQEYQIKEDKLQLNVEVYKKSKLNSQRRFLGSGKVNLMSIGGIPKLTLDKSLKMYDINLKESFIYYLVNRGERFFSPKKLLIELPMLSSFIKLSENFKKISIYDFDPKLAKKAIPISGRSELEYDGQNLAVVLSKLLTDPEKKRRFTNYLNNILPFVEDINVKKELDKYRIIQLKESYSKDNLVPASMISDGTINVAALIVALHFEKDNILVIEEPERNLHPQLISQIMDTIKLTSKKRQIFITTHNPEVLRYADPKDILLINRDNKGRSKVVRPYNHSRIKEFLKSELSMGDLYVQNAL